MERCTAAVVPIHTLLMTSQRTRLAKSVALAALLLPLLGTSPLSLLPAASAAESEQPWQPEAGFQSLFNGKDLSGWCYQPTEPFDGKTTASDNRYSGGDGILTVHPFVEGNKLRQLWTVKTFPKNFHLKLEFRAGVYADSGVFLRKPQLQCRDFYTAGPYYLLQKYKPQDWNTIEVIVKDNLAFCTCNGELLEPELKLPADGPIGLEADRGTMEYRHIQLKELE